MTVLRRLLTRLHAYIQARPKLRYWASVRWPIANLWNRLDSQCWADLVPWALGWNKGEAETWRESVGLVGGGERCRRVSVDHRDACCYCGKFVDGERYVDPDRPTLLTRLYGQRCPICRTRHADLPAHQHRAHRNEIAQWDATYADEAAATMTRLRERRRG